MIELVTGMRFPYDCEHRVYEIKKTHGDFGGLSSAPQYPTGGPTGGSFTAQEDIPQSSRTQRGKKPSSWNRLSKYIKGIFAHCAYASKCAYENRLENREAIRATREAAGLLPLSLIHAPPQFPDMPSLSDTSSEDEQQHEEPFQ
jgi:hypothetical protein